MKYFERHMIATVAAPWWKLLIARLFGDKTVWHEGDETITLYRYEGITYINKFEKKGGY